MSAMFDYITGKKSGREAELEASLEHMGGYLGAEIEDNEKLRAEIERLAAENEKLRAHLAQIKSTVVGDKNPRWSSDWSITSTRGWIADVCDHALEQ